MMMWLQKECIQIDIQHHGKDALIVYDMMSLVELNILIEGKQEYDKSFCQNSGIPILFCILNCEVIYERLM